MSVASVFESAPTIGEKIAKAQANPKFQRYLDTLTKKGVFKGVEEGSAGYIDRMSSIVSKFLDKVEAPSAPVSNVKDDKDDDEEDGDEDDEDDDEEEEEVTYSEEDLQKAENLKTQGNDLLKAKKYNEALDLYSQAVETVSKGPNSHIYYSNRAAAYTYLKNYDSAISDCKKAIKLDPTYVKAYSRAGSAYFTTGDYENAVEMYTRCGELDPLQQTHKDQLDRAQRKFKASSNSGGMDDMGDLASMMQGAGGLEGLGGLGGLGGLMNDPNFKSQAQKMMKDPKMMNMAKQMMSNPQMMQNMMGMLGNMGGGGGMPPMGGNGGQPDLDAMMAALGKGK